MKATIDWVKNNGLLIFEVITGSRSYGLDTAASDADIRGVFILPKSIFYSLEYIPQVSNDSNDIVYYELRRFMELLAKNNPNILEMLGVPKRCVLYEDKLMRRLSPQMFLSKLCEKTFANYAYTQIRKAYGLEKKIVNPVDEQRKSVLDFCFVYVNKEAIPAKTFLEKRGYEQEKAGLAAIPHLKDCYNLYYSERHVYSGIVGKDESNDVSLSNIPKEEIPAGMLYFNKDGYSHYCKKYREYWDWVKKRNVDRYKTTMEHGKNYDSKNMMHVFRLLFMAKEIAAEKKVNVFRKDREFLLGVKAGNYEYEELLASAEEIIKELPELYSQSDLQDQPDIKRINELLVDMREEYYKSLEGKKSIWEN
jgi:uncharacterized protein